MPFGFLRPKFRQISYNLPVIDPETIWSIKKFGTYEEKNNQLRKQFGIQLSYPKLKQLLKKSGPAKKKGGKSGGIIQKLFATHIQNAKESGVPLVYIDVKKLYHK